MSECVSEKVYCFGQSAKSFKIISLYNHIEEKITHTHTHTHTQTHTHKTVCSVV